MTDAVAVAGGIAGLVEATPDAMICADSAGVITFWNAAAERMFGLPREKAIGSSLDLIVPEPMRGAHSAGIKRLVAGGPTRVVGKVVEVQAQHVSGRLFAVEMSLAMWSEGGQPVFGAMVRDVSERRRNEDRLHHLAHFDQLTLLPNRTHFLEGLSAALGEAPTAAVLLLDLDRFKEVNDNFGHSAGDEILRTAALRIRQAVEFPDATVARLGGDEFAILLPGTSDPLLASKVADDIRASLSRPFELEARTVTIGCSVGIALAPNHGLQDDVLLGSADLALYQAKRDGGDTCFMFTPTLRDRAQSRRKLEGELRRALREDEFEVFYQPQVKLPTGLITGAEALLRWRHPDHGILAPAAFLDVLENSRDAEAVGKFVLRSACAQAVAWERYDPSFRMAVNLFSSQLRSDQLQTCVDTALADAGLRPSQLELEITENSLLDGDDTWVQQVKSLRSEGVGLAFDDYGTGYASLSLLKRLPLTRLKVDRSFVQDLGTDADDEAIVEAVISLARRLNLEVIAEGVETKQQAAVLQRFGCEQAQGYLFGKPMCSADFEGRLAAQTSLQARSA